MNQITFGRASAQQLKDAVQKQWRVQGKDGVPFRLERLEVTEDRAYPALPKDTVEWKLEGHTIGKKDGGLYRMIKVLFPKNDQDAVTDKLTVLYPGEQL